MWSVTHGVIRVVPREACLLPRGWVVHHQGLPEGLVCSGPPSEWQHMRHVGHHRLGILSVDAAIANGLALLISGCLDCWEDALPHAFGKGAEREALKGIPDSSVRGGLCGGVLGLGFGIRAGNGQ